MPESWFWVSTALRIGRIGGLGEEEVLAFERRINVVRLKSRPAGGKTLDSKEFVVQEDDQVIIARIQTRGIQEAGPCRLSLTRARLLFSPRLVRVRFIRRRLIRMWLIRMWLV